MKITILITKNVTTDSENGRFDKFVLIRDMEIEKDVFSGGIKEIT